MTEQEVFELLRVKAREPGFIEVVAFLALKEQIQYTEQGVSEDNLLHLGREGRLIDTELSVLIGLLMQSDFVLGDLDQTELGERSSEILELMDKMHNSMIEPMQLGLGSPGPSMHRESIFYAGETSFHHQYLDFALIRNKYDDAWFCENCEFSVEEVFTLLTFLGKPYIYSGGEVSILDPFIFEMKELEENLKFEHQKIKKILDAFSVSRSSNHNYQSVDDFNLADTQPIIELDDGRYCLFSILRLYQSFFESPYYWFLSDKKYQNQASIHRGQFAEDFCYERLSGIFEEQNIFKNVLLKDGSDVVGEIDVLVLYCNQAILIEAKSKRLTIRSRQGNLDSLESDFEKSVQYAYGQIVDNIDQICSGKVRLVTQDNKEISQLANISAFHPMCLLSENYPGLNFQVNWFLKQAENVNVRNPVIVDIFFLDVLAEMMKSPLLFFDYLLKRQQLHFKLLSPNEFSVLALHLRYGMSFDLDKFNMIDIGDDHTFQLQSTMLVRRTEAHGQDLPEGMLVWLSESKLGKLIQQLDDVNHIAAFELGLRLLDFNVVQQKQIESYLNMNVGDFSFLVSEKGIPTSFGITIIFHRGQIDESRKRLELFCEQKKYKERSNLWFGVSVDKLSNQITCVILLDDEWVKSKKIENEIRITNALIRYQGTSTIVASPKIGRNEPCYCGSNKKYKHCCILNN